MGMLDAVKGVATNAGKEAAVRDAVKTQSGATDVAADAIDALMTRNPGMAGLKAATYSRPAQASVTDETRTSEYQQAQAAIKAGRGDVPGKADSLWGAIKYKIGLADNQGGPTPKQVVQQAQQRQAAYDKQYRTPKAQDPNRGWAAP